MYACEHGHSEIVELLLKNNADIHAAATVRDYNCMYLIAAPIANYYTSLKNGWTPLPIACSNNFVRIANLLIKNGADCNRVIDEEVYIALSYVCGACMHEGQYFGEEAGRTPTTSIQRIPLYFWYWVVCGIRIHK